MLYDLEFDKIMFTKSLLKYKTSCRTIVCSIIALLEIVKKKFIMSANWGFPILVRFFFQFYCKQTCAQLYYAVERIAIYSVPECETDSNN